MTITSISISNKPKHQCFPLLLWMNICSGQTTGMTELLNCETRNCISALCPHWALRLYEAITWGVIDVTAKMLLNQSCVGAKKIKYGWIDKKRERERDRTWYYRTCTTQFKMQLHKPEVIKKESMLRRDSKFLVKFDPYKQLAHGKTFINSSIQLHWGQINCLTNIEPEQLYSLRINALQWQTYYVYIVFHRYRLLKGWSRYLERRVEK